MNMRMISMLFLLIQTWLWTMSQAMRLSRVTDAGTGAGQVMRELDQVQFADSNFSKGSNFFFEKEFSDPRCVTDNQKPCKLQVTAKEIRYPGKPPGMALSITTTDPALVQVGGQS